MSKKSQLSSFSLQELRVIREAVAKAETKRQLLDTIDYMVEQKEKALTEGMNACIPVTFFNIDPGYIRVLQGNGIENLAQLRDIPEADLWKLDGMTQGGFQQISWARDFFDMTPLEKMKPTERQDSLSVAKVIVKHANECRKKHGNV